MGARPDGYVNCRCRSSVTHPAQVLISMVRCVLALKAFPQLDSRTKGGIDEEFVSMVCRVPHLSHQETSYLAIVSASFYDGKGSVRPKRATSSCDNFFNTARSTER
jgi:hypothetical protein